MAIKDFRLDIYKIVIKKTRIAEGIFFFLRIRNFYRKIRNIRDIPLFSRTVKARKAVLCLHHRDVTKTLETGITAVAR